MKKILCSVMILAVAFAVIGCGNKKKADTYDFKGKVLVPCELDGQAIKACHMEPLPMISFDSVANRFNGNTGCNQMFGEFTCENEVIKFSNVGCTKMMCDPQANEIEASMLNVINNATSYAVSEDKVTFYADGKTLGVFKFKTNKSCKDKEGAEHQHCGKHQGAENAEHKHECQGHNHGEKAACANKPADATTEEPAVKEEVKSVAAPAGADLKVTNDKTPATKVESTSAASVTPAAKEPTAPKVATPSTATKTSQEKAADRTTNNAVK